jgi:hypothetical protein
MKDILSLSKEAIYLGISIVLIYIIIGNLVKKGFNQETCFSLKFNLTVLFISVVALHFIFEYTGVNKNYTDNYYK